MILIAVLPTYNEVGSLESVVSKLLRLDLPDIEIRLLIVDDASTDGTVRVAEELAGSAAGRIEILRRTNKRGLGSAYVEGFSRALASRADLIAQMDADLSHEPSVLAAMIEAISDADLVIGSRYVSGGGVDANWGWHRKVLSWLANRAVVPALFSLRVSDATSGYRLWRRETLASIAPSVNVRSSGYAFQVEMAYLADRLGYRIAEVPIYFRERDSGQSKLNVWGAFTALRDLLVLLRQRERPHRPG